MALEKRVESRPQYNLPPWYKANISLPGHRGNEEKIHYPANKENTEGKEIDGSGYGFTVIKPVCTEETENPDQVTDRQVMGLFFHGLSPAIFFFK